MKKLQTIVLILFLLPLFSFSQDFWEKINVPNNSYSSIAIGDNNDIFLGSSSDGVIKSADNGYSWEYIGLDEHIIYSLSLNNEGNLLAGVGIYSGIFLMNIESEEWMRVFSSISNVISIEPGYDNTVFSGSGSINRSLDDGNTWESFYNFENEQPRSIAVMSPDTVYFGITDFTGGGGVYRSVDNGETWENAGLADFFVQALAITSTGDLYAGCIGQYYYGWYGLYRLNAVTDTWDTLNYNQRIWTIEITDEDVIYCGVSYDEYKGGIIRSDDFGETWTMDTSGLGNQGVKELLLDNNEKLYALTFTNKLYRSSQPVSIKNHPHSFPAFYSYCYPNPTKTASNLYFEIGENNEQTDLYLRLYTINGQLILEKKLSYGELAQQKVTINKQGLQNGIYYYVLKGNKYYSSGKIILTN